jgi:hypothetical protein
MGEVCGMHRIDVKLIQIIYLSLSLTWSYSARKQQNNEGKQHRKNTNGKHAEGDHVRKKGSEPKKQQSRIFQAYENKYMKHPTHLKMAM